jgi:probable HAF family extracellular repeat protein
MPILSPNAPRNVQRIHYYILFALFVMESLAQAQDYKITKLGPYTSPAAINSSGQVAGTTYQNGSGSAFLWTRTGGLQILPELGGGETVAYAMNDSGAIVGDSALPNKTLHAFLWTQAGGIQDLGSPLGGRSGARAINAAGQVMGFTYSPDETVTHAFFWSSSTGAVDLGVTGGNKSSSANGINSNGEVVGIQLGPPGLSAFRWTLATGLQTLANFGVPGAMAATINISGQITGYAEFSSEDAHACVWSPDGIIHDLGVVPGEGTSKALFINSAGHVAGFSRLRELRGKYRTFFWSAAGMVDIGILPNHTNSSTPFGFNNRDQIIGVNGGTFLWIPTIGLRPVPGLTLASSLQVSNAFNDAGQILGYASTTAVLASPTMHVGLTSSRNPSQAGQSVTFTANVSAIVGLPPDGEQVIFKDGSKILGTGTLSNGTASFTSSSLAVKTHYITANYVGDNNYLSSKSAKLQQIVNP